MKVTLKLLLSQIMHFPFHILHHMYEHKRKKMRERSQARKVLELLVHILMSHVDIFSKVITIDLSFPTLLVFFSNPVKSRIMGCNIYFISVKA